MGCEEALLEVNQVSAAATVGDRFLLRDVSFAVKQGERLAIVGPAGAGKTTLLRLLNRLSEPAQGTIYLHNTDLCLIPVAQVRRQVMLLLQESSLLGMTVRDALRYPLQLRKLDAATIRQRLEEWLNKLHIPSDWLDRSELQLSGGQRQLVAIARACIHQPEILLLDEPTSSLDVGRSALVLGALNSLVEDHQTTILMVNHQLDLAEQLSNRVLYLEQGRLVLDKPASQVDWHEIKDRLHRAEVEAQIEWGDESFA
jgi:D-methionine transport system ATP-binding protein